MARSTEIIKQDYVSVQLNEKEADVFVFTIYKGTSKIHFNLNGKRHEAWVQAFGLHVEELHTYNDIIVEKKPRYNYGYLCNREVDMNSILVELKQCKSKGEMDSLMTSVLKEMYVSRMSHDAREEHIKLHESFTTQKQNLLERQKKQEQYDPNEWLRLLKEWRRMYRN